MSEPSCDFDVVVVGGGHAGCEAALAAARMGARTALLTSQLDTIGQMSCNPAIGGIAKGQIVREIDALGGAMGQAIDATGIQFRMLNRRKGPAMHGPRAQADRMAYHVEMKRRIEREPNLFARQETVDELLVEEAAGAHRAVGVRVCGGTTYRAGAVVLATGTFMQGLLHYGRNRLPGGRAGEATHAGISRTLKRLGFQIARFKTGTPPRLNGRAIDYSRTELQPGDDRPEPFSFLTERIDREQLPCWITYTNRAVHDLIRANLHRAPMVTGQIQSIGPRYCPSVETKVIRFAQKERHQLFLEPEGRHTSEVYLNGLSTSLPPDVQDAMVGSIAGLERAQIVRYGYAIEYDYLPPEQLTASLETKRVAGLYLAGQINGTTGYEEAAGQGLVAGANAALALCGREPLVLGREQAYLGVMIDDLVTRGVDEPYRMFTSRAEYRLRLRHDNADRRLTPLAHELGLVDQARWKSLEEKVAGIARVGEQLKHLRVGEVSAAQWVRRPEVSWADLVKRVGALAEVPDSIARQILIDAKYAGYIARQDVEIARQARLAQRRIPDQFDYDSLTHMRFEARERLAKVRPANLSQAERIRGITLSDLAVLVIHLESSRAQAREAVVPEANKPSSANE